MGEEAIDDEGVDGNDDGGSQDGDYAQVEDGDALLDGILVVECVVLQREFLVVGFDGIEGVEGDDEDAGGGLALERMGKDVVCCSAGGAWRLRAAGRDVHNNEVVEDVAAARKVSRQRGREQTGSSSRDNDGLGQALLGEGQLLLVPVVHVGNSWSAGLGALRRRRRRWELSRLDLGCAALISQGCAEAVIGFAWRRLGARC